MSFGVSLYHPYIHIFDVDWLKRSLLYWDRLRRIVPDGVQPSDSVDCAKAVEANLLVSTSPAPYLSESAQRFKAKIPALVDEIIRRGESFAVEDPEAAARDHERRIHLNKVESWLRSFLVDQQLAQVEGEWLVSHAEVPDWYMTCLATVMSEQEVLQLCSHSVIDLPDDAPSLFGLRSIQVAAIRTGSHPACDRLVCALFALLPGWKSS
jgi:hypothetical protein